jgi:hypothetical protein
MLFIPLIIALVTLFFIGIMTHLFSAGMSEQSSGFALFLYLLYHFLAMAFSYYGFVVLFPIYISVKTTFDASYYLSFLARYHHLELHPIAIHSKVRYFFKAVGLIVVIFMMMAGLLILCDETALEFLVPTPLLLIYVLIYKNWINALELGIGEEFKSYYEEHRVSYIFRGILYLILMHIPITFLFQPWIILILAAPYFKSRDEHYSS